MIKAPTPDDVREFLNIKTPRSVHPVKVPTPDEMTDEQFMAWMEDQKRLEEAKRKMESESAKKLREWKRELNEARGIKEGSITDEMIERAREVPIDSMVEVKLGKTRCLWHDDKNPSMSIKNNRAKCWSCGKRSSSIDFYMELNGVGFKSAVRRMV